MSPERTGFCSGLGLDGARFQEKVSKPLALCGRQLETEGCGSGMVPDVALRGLSTVALWPTPPSSAPRTLEHSRPGLRSVITHPL